MKDTSRRISGSCSHRRFTPLVSPAPHTPLSRAISTLRTLEEAGNRLRSLSVPHAGRTVNNNNGSGTFNNVAGDLYSHCSVSRDQHTHFNSNVTLELGQIPSDLDADKKPSFVGVSIRNYADAIAHLTQICTFLQNKLGTVTSPLNRMEGGPVDKLLAELRRLTAHLADVGRAFDIVDDLPRPLRTLQYFLRIKEFMQDSTSELQGIRCEVHEYDTRQAEYLQADFSSGLEILQSLHIRFHTVLERTNHFLTQMGPVLYGFLRIILSGWCERLAGEGAEVSRLAVLRQQVESSCVQNINHLRLDQFLLRDQLGHPIAIPIEFCTDWKDLDIVVQRMCRSIDGGDHILRNEWEMLQPAENHTRVDRSSPVWSVLKPGLELAISIILQAMGASSTICPQCDFDNSETRTSLTDWIICSKCDNTFHIDYIPRSALHPSRPHQDHAAGSAIRPLAPSIQPSMVTSDTVELTKVATLSPRRTKFRLVSVRAHAPILTWGLLPRLPVRKRPRRRYESYDEIDRIYHCYFANCTKAYCTLNHLNAHISMGKHGLIRSVAEFKEVRQQWRKAKREALEKEKQASLARQAAAEPCPAYS